MGEIVKKRVFLNIDFWGGNIAISEQKDVNPNNLSIEFLVNKKNFDEILALRVSALEFVNVHYKEQFQFNNYINSLSKNKIIEVISELTKKIGGRSNLLKF